MTKPFRLTLLAVLSLALVVAAACYPPATPVPPAAAPGAIQRHHEHRLAVDERCQQDDRRNDHGPQPDRPTPSPSAMTAR